MAKKVLVIDDDPEMLGLIKQALERGGLEVSTWESGRHAFEEIARIKPDLLVLDVMLPGVDGYSLQLSISENPSTKDIPIIVLTALEPSKTLFQKFPQVVAFMTKPFSPEDLAAAAQSALARSPRA